MENSFIIKQIFCRVKMQFKEKWYFIPISAIYMCLGLFWGGFLGNQSNRCLKYLMMFTGYFMMNTVINAFMVRTMSEKVNYLIPVSQAERKHYIRIESILCFLVNLLAAGIYLGTAYLIGSEVFVVSIRCFFIVGLFYNVIYSNMGMVLYKPLGRKKKSYKQIVIETSIVGIAIGTVFITGSSALILRGSRKYWIVAEIVGVLISGLYYIYCIYYLKKSNAEYESINEEMVLADGNVRREYEKSKESF